MAIDAEVKQYIEEYVSSLLTKQLINELATVNEENSKDFLLLNRSDTNAVTRILASKFMDLTLADLGTKTFQQNAWGTAAATLLSQIKSAAHGNGNAWLYNCIPENKDISDAFYNGNLKAEIAAGNFQNVRPGNYIIGKNTDKKYYVAHLDYYYQHGNTSFAKHHLLMMCAWNTGSDKMNETNITTGGYKGSYMRSTVLPKVLENYIEKDFGNNVLSAPILMTSATNTSLARGNGLTGASSSWEWVDSKLEIPNEMQVYGASVWGTSFDVGNRKEQLAIFKLLGYNKVIGRDSLWLSDVASASQFAGALNNGAANCTGASNSNLGVRPCFAVGTP